MGYCPALRARWNLSTASAALFALGLLGALLWRLLAPTPAERLTAARVRWEARQGAPYRLVMRAPAWCYVDVEVRDERVIAAFQSPCPRGPRTVTELFDMIAQLDGEPAERHCSPDGCQCTEVATYQATYDRQLGFPRAIWLRRLREPNWPLLWRYLLSRGLPLCLSPPATEIVVVISLQPIAR